MPCDRWPTAPESRAVRRCRCIPPGAAACTGCRRSPSVEDGRRSPSAQSSPISASDGPGGQRPEVHDVVVSLFVSYSRTDAQFVRQLTAALEADGHDVWVDTQDIVGSEQWRASIVAAVQRADAVLLVVSPRSMASPNVEREVTVAAEESRRIVPLVLEPAEMTGSILFELAGTQQISFANREFDIAMQDLRKQLLELGADPVTVTRDPPTPVALPSPARTRRFAAAAVVGVVGVALVA